MKLVLSVTVLAICCCFLSPTLAVPMQQVPVVAIVETVEAVPLTTLHDIEQADQSAVDANNEATRSARGLGLGLFSGKFGGGGFGLGHGFKGFGGGFGGLGGFGGGLHGLGGGFGSKPFFGKLF